MLLEKPIHCSDNAGAVIMHCLFCVEDDCLFQVYLGFVSNFDHYNKNCLTKIHFCQYNGQYNLSIPEVNLIRLQAHLCCQSSMEQDMSTPAIPMHSFVFHP